MKGISLSVKTTFDILTTIFIQYIYNICVDNILLIFTVYFTFLRRVVARASPGASAHFELFLEYSNFVETHIVETDILKSRYLLFPPTMFTVVFTNKRSQAGEYLQFISQ